MVGGTEADVVVTWLAANTRADGVLSTKSDLVRAARRAGLVAVQRFFLVDSFSYHQLPRVVEQAVPDAIEILPGCVPRVITWLRADTDVPIIAGGLVCDKADVMAALVRERSPSPRRTVTSGTGTAGTCEGTQTRLSGRRPGSTSSTLLGRLGGRLHEAAHGRPEGQVRRDVG